MHVDLNIADIRTKSVDINIFRHHTNEMNLGMPMLREISYIKNVILK